MIKNLAAIALIRAFGGYHFLNFQYYKLVAIPKNNGMCVALSIIPNTNGRFKIILMLSVGGADIPFSTPIVIAAALVPFLSSSIFVF